jgi:hypothetical protein
MNRYHRACVLACLLVIPAVPLGLVGALLVWGGRWLWRTRVTVPGFSLVDSRAWRRLRSVQFDETRQRMTSRRDVNSMNVLGAVLGLCVGISLTPVVVLTLNHVIDAQNPSNLGFAILCSAVLLALCGSTAVGLNLSQRLQRRMVKHQLVTRAAKTERKRLAGPKRAVAGKQSGCRDCSPVPIYRSTCSGGPRPNQPSVH